MLIWICQHSMEKKSCLTTLCDEIGWVDERRAVNIVYLVFSEAFIVVSRSILLNKPIKFMPGGWTVKATGNCQIWWAQRVSINGTTSQVAQKLVASHWQCTLGSVSGTILFNTFATDLGVPQRCNLTKLAGGTDRPKRVVLISRGTLTEELSDGNLQKFSDPGEEPLQAPVCGRVQSAEKKVQKRTQGSWWERFVWAIYVHLEQRRPEVFWIH